MSSDPRVRGAWILALLLLWGGSAGARVLITVDEALALAFPNCAVERRTLFLTEEQVSHAAELAGEPPTSALVHRYEATREGEPFATAYFDTHRVRTLPETIMVVVGAGGEVRRVEVLSFDEPPDYMPREGWYGQFEGQALSDELDLDRGIRRVTGATLTGRATTDAVRRVLALHQAIGEGKR